MNTLIAANLACLKQGIELLERFPPPAYARPCEAVFNSSIGGHIRHNLDHYTAFFSGESGGQIDYDERQRERGIEADPVLAIDCMKGLIVHIEKLGSVDLNRPLKIRMDDGGDSSWSQTTLRRELQFLLSHSIHHYALVVSIATRYGFTEFPKDFGIAPSTIHYQEQKGA